MDKVKQWVALTVVGALALATAGWFLAISPKRSEAADLRAQTATQVSTNQTLAVELEVLKAKAQELPKKQADLAKVAAKIPTNPALPALVRALTAASTTAGVELVSVTPGAPTAQAPVAAAAAAPAASGAPAPAPAAPAPAAPAAPGAAPAPASAAGTLALIPITISVVGDYYEVEQFVANLEQLPRALKVMNLAVTPGTSPTAGKTASATSAEDGRSLTTTITGSVFMATGAAPATAVVAPTAAPAK